MLALLRRTRCRVMIEVPCNEARQADDESDRALGVIRSRNACRALLVRCFDQGIHDGISFVREECSRTPPESPVPSVEIVAHAIVDTTVNAVADASYEDCVAGANADVLVFYRSSDDRDMLGGDVREASRGSASAMSSKASAAPVAVRDGSCPLDPAVPSAAIASAECCASIHTPEDAALSALPLALARPGSLEAPSDTAIGSPAVTATATATATVTATATPAGTGVREDDCGVEAGGAGASGKPVLTIIVRPLPSTAPASLDSDSCAGEGGLDGWERAGFCIRG